METPGGSAGGSATPVRRAISLLWPAVLAVVVVVVVVDDDDDEWR
jgi:hypothetical protein